jgi:hypothetical protein
MEGRRSGGAPPIMNPRRGGDSRPDHPHGRQVRKPHGKPLVMVKVPWGESRMTTPSGSFNCRTECFQVRISAWTVRPRTLKHRLRQHHRHQARLGRLAERGEIT